MRYLPIDASVARRARDTMRDAHGNALQVQTSTDDGNPCRACLRLTPAGTRLILLAHRPFVTGGPYAETGPIFVHADETECQSYAAIETFPPDFRPRTLTFRAYDRDGAIAGATVAPGSAAETTLAAFFARDDVAEVHVRNPAWGCYDFRVERGEHRTPRADDGPPGTRT